MTRRLVGTARSPLVDLQVRPAPRPRSDVLPVGFLGVGAALPAAVVTNDDLSRTLDTDDEWIRSRTGIERRHVAAPTEATSDLAIVAGRRALAAAGLDPIDLAAIVVATTTPDHPIPATAPLVAAALGSDAAAFDVNAACSGFVYGLRVAGPLALAEGPVLLVASEVLTRLVDPTDRSTAVLFGDGAGAVVLATSDDGATIGPFDLGADGTLADLLVTPAGGTRAPSTPSTLADGGHWLQMQGSEVYRAAVAHMIESAQAVLDAAGMTAGDVDLMIAHQANLRIVEAVARRLGIDLDRCITTVSEHGNTSAASIPLAIDHALRAGQVPGDARILLSAFGAGLTWGSCLLDWPTPPPAGEVAP